MMKLLVGIGCLVIGGMVFAAAKAQPFAADRSDSRIGTTTTGIFKYSAPTGDGYLHERDPLDDVGVEQMQSPNIRAILEQVRANSSSVDVAVEKLRRDRAQSESTAAIKRRSSRRKSKPEIVWSASAPAATHLEAVGVFGSFSDDESLGCPSPKSPLPPLSPRFK